MVEMSDVLSDLLSQAVERAAERRPDLFGADPHVQSNGGRQKLLTTQELADYYGVHRMTITRWVHDRGCPCRQVGAVWRFHHEEVEEWLRTRPGRGRRGRRGGGAR